MKKTKTILITSFALLFFGAITTFATWPTVPEGSVIGGWLGEVFDISNSNSTKLIIESANVGIGTTSPTQKLEVNGNIKSSGRHLYLGENLLYSDNSSALTSRSNHDTATQITLQDAQSTNYGRVYGDGDGQNFGLLDGDTHWSYLAAKNNYTQFLINNSAKMTILNNGNVGIGTDNPIQKLEVNGKIKMNSQTTASDSNDTVVTKGYVDNNGSSFTWGELCNWQYAVNEKKTLLCSGDRFLIDAFCSDEGNTPDCQSLTYGYGGGIIMNDRSYAGILCCKNP